MSNDLRTLSIKGPGGLRDVAGQLGVKNRSNLNKRELIEQITRARRGRRQTEASRMKRQGQEAIRQAQRLEQVARPSPPTQTVQELQGLKVRGPGGLMKMAQRFFVPGRWRMRKQELIEANKTVARDLKREAPLIDKYGEWGGNSYSSRYVLPRTPQKLRQWLVKKKEEFESLRLRVEDLLPGREKRALKKKLEKKKEFLDEIFQRQEEEEEEGEVEYNETVVFNGVRRNFSATAPPSPPKMDIDTFFERVKERLEEELEKMAKPFKVNMVLTCEYEKREADGKMVIEDFHHVREIESIFQSTNLTEYLEDSKEVLKEKSEVHTESGSGWMF